MLDFGFYNMDCMDGMREFPDKYFDLAIVDPPYGINVGGKSADGNISVGSSVLATTKVYHGFDDSKTPERAYFEELERVSRNRIIWGGQLLYPIFTRLTGLDSMG